jgi:protocatechuate 3,4-dioxygenase beta subunit
MSESDESSGLTRREALGAGAVASAAFVVPSLLNLAGGGTPAALGAAATLTPEAEEGPYYVALEHVRRQIAAGQAGAPLHLAVGVRAASTGAAVVGAAVDIWHCNARGIYSDEAVEGNVGTTFLRGVQLTGTDGIARFITIYPGHYQGRATHIHVKVHVAGSSNGAKYSGGHVCHTGQLFFDDPTSSNSIYRQEGGSHTRVTLRRRAGTLANAGFDGAVTLVVNPSATPAAVGRGNN